MKERRKNVKWVTTHYHGADLCSEYHITSLFERPEGRRCAGCSPVSRQHHLVSSLTWLVNVRFVKN